MTMMMIMVVIALLMIKCIYLCDCNSCNCCVTL